MIATGRMESAGSRALLARVEILRLPEGLFDADRKHALPVLPSVIGLITSEHGAVIQDIRTTITRRFPRQVFACGQGASWPPLDTARRSVQAVHRAADQANPLEREMKPCPTQ